MNSEYLTGDGDKSREYLTHDGFEQPTAHLGGNFSAHDSKAQTLRLFFEMS
jgi:hypothetical protein